jgi:hypothetical protein
LAEEAAILEYRDFHDFPRIFVAVHRGDYYLFDGSFDDALDDYPDYFVVHRLPHLQPSELRGSWEHLADRATAHIGRVPTSAVTFDGTRRKFIRSSVFDASRVA